MRGFDEGFSQDLGHEGFGSGFCALSKRGSLDFLNGSNNFLLVPNSANFAVGTGDFTVEWWQYVDNVTVYMRYFSIGTYAGGITLGVASQSGNMYFWIASSGNGVGTSLGSHGTVTDGWHHFAIVRASGNVKMYKDGANISGAGVSNSNNATYDASRYFAIGTETSDGLTSSIPGSVDFDGKMTNFRFVKGTALYTSNFTPAGPLDVVTNTQLLLLTPSLGNSLRDSSNLGLNVSSVGSVAWNRATPF